MLVVSHEASATGAPILSLNLGETLSATHTVIHLVLATPGPLSAELRQHSHWVLHTKSPELTPATWRRAQRHLPRGLHIRFAIINSVVAFRALETLRRQGIAGLCLVHEFAAYVRPPLAPKQAYLEAALWAHELVFSAALTRDEALKHWPALQSAAIRVLPQGQSRPPKLAAPQGPNRNAQSPAGLESLAQRLERGCQLVLGAGAVQPRKGVDLFIATARALEDQQPNPERLYIWLGGGYEPDHDLMVSVWLEDQITRCGLKQQLHILEAPEAYSWLMQRCQVFVLSSRLDPLPNVAIDAALAAKPVLAFDKASGIADWLAQDPLLQQTCVARYLDPSAMAQKAAALLHDQTLAAQVGDQCFKRAKDSFDLKRYAEALVQLGEEAERALQQEQLDLKHLLEQPDALDREFHALPKRWSQRHLLHHYLRQWRSGILPRKPKAGFHPGIYREAGMGNGHSQDPLLHWIKQGEPRGPWQHQLITPRDPRPAANQPPRVGVHLHVHYGDQLPVLLKGLQHNRLDPQLVISINDSALKDSVLAVVEEFGMTLLELHVVPNRGRNLGPLFSGIGRDLEQQVEIYAHLHTKRSPHEDPRRSERWRQFLVEQLLGTEQVSMGDRVVKAMLRDPSIGMIFPDDPSAIGWDANHQHAAALAQTFNLGTLPHHIEVPVGAMFWARRGALSAIYEQEWPWEVYPSEPLPSDGTMLHAMERLLPLISREAGFQTARCQVPSCSR